MKIILNCFSKTYKNKDVTKNMKPIIEQKNNEENDVEEEEEEEEEEENDDDDDDESNDIVDVLQTYPPRGIRPRQARHSVSAEVYGEWNKQKNFVAPVYIKTPDQENRIRDVLTSSFMFQTLDQEDLKTVSLAFVEVRLKDGDVLIKQGDDGDSLYLIESGEVDIFKLIPTEINPRHMCVMVPGDTVGELALLYNAPRAATVVAKGDVILWKLDRESFNHIVKAAAMRKRDMYEKFLKEVEILKDMDPYERSKLSDGLRDAIFNSGDTIITQGDIGDTFYIIESGKAVAIKDGVKVLEYQRGDYFGELALIRNQPRAATVKAIDGRVKCLCLDRKSFRRLLGPIEDILKRNAARYDQVRSSLTPIA